MAYQYDPNDKFGYKDTLPEGHEEKIIKGSEFDEEFRKIAGAFAIFDPDGDGDISIDNIDGLQDALDKERQERIDADADLQSQIDALDPDGDRNVDWDEIQNKPTEFPPEAHNQDWSTITNTPSEYPPEAHTHEQSEIDGLEDRLTQIEGSITDGGSFVDAPNDGQLYGRQSEAWAVVPDGGASSWNDLTDKPTEFPPEAHTQDWSTITNTPSEYPPSDHTHEIADVDGLQDALDAAGGAPAWDDVTGKPTEFPPEAHTQDWSTITNTPSEYPPSAHNHDGVYQPVGNYIEDADSDGKQYARKDGAWSEVVIPEGGTGSSVHIGEAPPADPQEGQQWMEVPATGDATMWIYDGDKWLQHPSGKDGAPGQDGADGNIADATEQGVIATWDNTAGQWTPEGGVVVDANGNVGIGANNAVTTGLSLKGDYNLSWKEGSGTSICNAFRQAQTGRLVLSQGYKWSPSAGGFASSQGGEFARTAVSLGGEIKFFADAAVNVPEGTDFTPTERMRIDADGSATFNGATFWPVCGGKVDSDGLNFSTDNYFYSYAGGQSGQVFSGIKLYGSTKSISFYTAQKENMTIDASGSVGIGGDTSLFHPFSNRLVVESMTVTDYNNGGFARLDFSPQAGSSLSQFGSLSYDVNNNAMQIVTGGAERMSIDASGRVDITGSLYVNGTPKIGTVDLIKAFSKLRDAVKDEETVESLKESITNCIGGLIEEWEAMQSPATQEINDE